MATDKGEESRLARWSRMKLEAREKQRGGDGEGQDHDALKNAVGEGDDGAAADAVEPAEGAADEMPVPEDLVDLDIENLEPGYDFSRFMRDDVPDMLRRRGLRQLWRSNSVLANLDGMNEYDEDYTDAAVGVAAMKDFFTQTIAKQEKLKEAADRAEAALGDGEPAPGDDGETASAGEGGAILSDAGVREAGVSDAGDKADFDEGDGTSSLRLDDEAVVATDIVYAENEQPQTGGAEGEQMPSSGRQGLVADTEDGAAEAMPEENRLTVLASRGWLPIQ